MKTRTAGRVVPRSCEALGLAVVLMAGSGCADAPLGELLPSARTHTYVEDPTKEISEQPGKFAGGPGNTHDHQDALSKKGGKDPFEVLAQRREEGPPAVRTRLHSCQKVRIAALASMLQAFGVDLSATGDPPTAGQLLAGGLSALGAPNYDARTGEALVWTAAGAAKLFDVLVQAAPEIIAGIEQCAQCRLGGKSPKMFDGERCDADAVTCLIGRPASAALLAVCDDLVASASDVETGKKLAVAALMSAAHSCE